MLLTIDNLRVRLDDKPILNGIRLTLLKGKILALMGPNGSGKSTLAHVLMGDPKYTVEGRITYQGEDLLGMTPDERSRKGVFMSFQHPRELPGVKVKAFFRAILHAHGKLNPQTFLTDIQNAVERVGLPRSVLDRDVNVGFSGGEKKRLEIAQLLLLDPTLIILDELDSGLDVDALRHLAGIVKSILTPEKSVILITHYSRILHHLEPDEVIILKDGSIVKKGPARLAWEIEEKGYGILEA